MDQAWKDAIAAGMKHGANVGIVLASAIGVHGGLKASIPELRSTLKMDKAARAFGISKISYKPVARVFRHGLATSIKSNKALIAGGAALNAVAATGFRKNRNK